MSALWLGLGIGFFGSLHCLGMCGPLAMALPYRTTNTVVRAGKSVLYNIGRTLTYIILGLALASLGQGMFLLGLQKFFSVSFGILLIYFILLPQQYRRVSFFIENSELITKVKIQFRNQFQKKNPTVFLFAGMLNGLIPCGMVYMAAIAAMGTSSIESGMSLMAGFGLGTFPALTLIASFGSVPSLSKIGFSKLQPAVLLVVGILMISRGLLVEMPNVPELGILNPSNFTLCK